MGKTIKPAAVKTAIKKSASKKDVSSTSGIKPIKYADKSGGQPQLVPVFKGLRELFLHYAKGAMLVTVDEPGQVHLCTAKPVEAPPGKRRDNLYFASLLMQKGYVGFYLMSVYADASVKNQIAPELLKCLKGKTCFHIKKLDDTLKEQIQHALQAGYEHFEKKGWL